MRLNIHDNFIVSVCPEVVHLCFGLAHRYGILRFQMTRVVDHCHCNFVWLASGSATRESLSIADSDVRGYVIDSVDQLFRDIILARCLVQQVSKRVLI